MQNDHRWIAPVPQPEPEVLVVYALTREFHREVEQREAFEQYCQWYRNTAEQNRRELHKLRQDVNVFGWFCRGRR
ncbi:hypothetical protein H6F43_21635 [Leptolyngbya sp. FACHB-36]|uniref:hypothetical protein n=1 Tax=Leptolyngbya sp. FACHB-36 TaxID=2692808 RepID=UPI0016800C8E|nr:hypothetical protein [Leptolyngbya sp. FACHB-36]MBD2022789.1 hypothetical protein [Leptolyngbya sp. FACHB-36]